LLLRQIDRQIGLMQSVANAIDDYRQTDRVQHDCLSILRQRVYGLAMGYEDLNDHHSLRLDPAIQTAINKENYLASPATLCRFENNMSREAAVSIHKVIVDKFIESFKKPPKELILDFDATDDPTHGKQEKCFFHGYYDHYCFLPLYVFCEDQLLVSYLRPSNIDGAKHSWAILSLLVKRLRQAWPDVKIIFRGDSGFCRHRMFDWCEKNNVDYIVGLAGNQRLQKYNQTLVKQAEKNYLEKDEKQRLFDSFQYAAKSWLKQRYVIAKAEYSSRGLNTRFVVSSIKEDPKNLYDTLYCARGDMENRIKEQQLGLFADRTSSHHWWSNQCRLLLSSLAYVLMDAIRRLTLKNTKLAKAQMTTIRLKLLKIGAIVLKNTRRIRFLFASAYPYKELFKSVAAQLQPRPG
jgi:hypothetical protein